MDLGLVVPEKHLLEIGGECGHKYISMMWFSKSSMGPVQEYYFISHYLC